MVFGAFNLLAGLLGIQLLSQQKRKNAFIASSFFRAATFRFGQLARKLRRTSRSN